MIVELRWKTKKRQDISDGLAKVTANALAAYLAKQAAMDTLRFITCGSIVINPH